MTNIDLASRDGTQAVANGPARPANSVPLCLNNSCFERPLPEARSPFRSMMKQAPHFRSASVQCWPYEEERTGLPFALRPKRDFAA